MNIKIIQFLAGIAILIVYIWKLDVSESFSNLKGHVNYLYLTLAFLLSFFTLVVRAVRWKYVSKKLNIADIKFFNSLEYTSASFFVSLLTPGKVGDASRTIFMKNSNKAEVLAGVTIEYFFDGLTLILLIFYFSLVFLYKVKLFLSIIILLLILMVLQFFILKKVSVERIGRITMLKNMRIIEGKDTYTQLLRKGITEHRIISTCFFSSFLIYFILFSAIYIAFLSISVQIDIITLFAGLAIGQFIGVISFIPLGLGSREVGSLSFFVFVGYDPIVIGSALIVARLIMLFPFIIGYLFYLRLTAISSK